MFGLSQKSSLVPAVMKVKGDDAEVAFTNFALTNYLPQTGFRQKNLWFWRKFAKNADGTYDVLVITPDYELSARKILEKMGFTVLGIEYGTIKPDSERKVVRLRSSYTVTLNGRTVQFDLSTE